MCGVGVCPFLWCFSVCARVALVFASTFGIFCSHHSFALSVWMDIDRFSIDVALSKQVEHNNHA